MTQPPPPPNPPAQPPVPKSQEEAMAAWQEEQGYQKFATWMSRWIGEQKPGANPPPAKTEKPKGFLDGFFG